MLLGVRLTDNSIPSSTLPFYDFNAGKFLSILHSTSIYFVIILCRHWAPSGDKAMGKTELTLGGAGKYLTVPGRWREPAECTRRRGGWSRDA